MAPAGSMATRLLRGRLSGSAEGRPLVKVRVPTISPVRGPGRLRDGRPGAGVGRQQEGAGRRLRPDHHGRAPGGFGHALPGQVQVAPEVWRWRWRGPTSGPARCCPAPGRPPGRAPAAPAPCSRARPSPGPQQQDGGGPGQAAAAQRGGRRQQHRRQRQAGGADPGGGLDHGVAHRAGDGPHAAPGVPGKAGAHELPGQVEQGPGAAQHGDPAPARRAPSGRCRTEPR